MALLAGNCPICKTKNTTFKVLKVVDTAENAQTRTTNEAFLLCKRCNRTSAAHIKIEDLSFSSYKADIERYEIYFNNIISISSFVDIKKEVSRHIPDGLPEKVRETFKEALICMEYDCYNASVSTFRTCIDIATRSLIPAENTNGISEKTRRDLRLRLNWLIQNNKISNRLEGLADCIREDGNEAVHAATLSADDAMEIYDFTYFFLEEMYSISFRLEAARARRSSRNQKQN